MCVFFIGVRIVVVSMSVFGRGVFQNRVSHIYPKKGWYVRRGVYRFWGLERMVKVKCRGINRLLEISIKMSFLVSGNESWVQAGMAMAHGINIQMI